MTELNKDGQSILMVTHDIKSALRANRLIYIEDGKIGGEMDLKPYHSLNLNDKAEIKDRETQVNSWLSSMNW